MSSASPTAADSHANALPPGTRLGEYEIRRVIGVGGFGIVYLAFDHGLEREVAIKEYMPSSLASRTATLHVSITSPSHAETFALGLRSFINEARLLARFDHRSLIKVHRFWEDSGTAYMVMPLMRGRTLREVRRAMRQSPDEAWLRRLLEPLLGALEVLHREEVYHRDIAPDNILVGDDDVPVLLDFGAARHVISGRTQTLTAILKPAYAPIEQYGEATNLRQGAWTDLYALGATLHYLITETPPAPATVRTVTDDAAPLASTPRLGLGTEFLRAVDWMLQPRPADRPQSVAQLREVLEGRRRPPVRNTGPQVPAAGWEPTAVMPVEDAGLPTSPVTPMPVPRAPAQAPVARPAGGGMAPTPGSAAQPPKVTPAPAAGARTPAAEPQRPAAEPAAVPARAPVDAAAAPMRAAVSRIEPTAAPDPIEEAMRSAVRERPTGARRSTAAASTWESRHQGARNWWWAGGAAALMAAGAMAYWWTQRGEPAASVRPAASAPLPALVASAPAAVPTASAAGSAVAAPAAALASAAGLPAPGDVSVSGTAPAAAQPPAALTPASAAPAGDDGRKVTAVVTGSARAAGRHPAEAPAGTGTRAATPGNAGGAASAAGARSGATARTAPPPAGGGAAPAQTSGALLPVPARRMPPPAGPILPPAPANAAAGSTGTAATSGADAAAPTSGRSPEAAPAVVSSGPRDPREQCGGRMLLALHLCLVRECVKPQYYDHPQCQQVRSIEERARQRQFGQ